MSDSKEWGESILWILSQISLLENEGTSCWSACQSACSALIGQYISRDLNTGLWLADDTDTGHSSVTQVRPVCTGHLRWETSSNKEIRVTICCRRNMLRVQGAMREAYTIESDQRKVGHHHSYFHYTDLILIHPCHGYVFPWQFLFWCTAKMQCGGRRKKRGGQGWFEICVWENWRTLYPKLSNCQSRPCKCIAEKN